MKEKEKFFIIGIVIMMVVLLFVSCFVGGKKTEMSTKLSNDSDEVYENAQKESTSIKSSEKKDFIQIDVKSFITYLEGSEQKIVLVARPTCQFCQIAEPIIQHVAYKYDLDINYLDTDNFSDDDSDTFFNSNELFQDDFGTPTLLIVKDNDIVDSVGLTDFAHYVDFFKKNGYIKE